MGKHLMFIFYRRLKSFFKRSLREPGGWGVERSGSMAWAWSGVESKNPAAEKIKRKLFLSQQHKKLGTSTREENSLSLDEAPLCRLKV
jgi:hypothetical protein